MVRPTVCATLKLIGEKGSLVYTIEANHIRFNTQMTVSLMEDQLPMAVTPLLAKVLRGLGRNAPLDFWTIDHGPTILNGFCELASLLELSDIDEDKIPYGYILLTRLFNWEAACQFGGWGAFASISDKEFKAVLQCFNETGLSDEAESLQVQMIAYQKNPDDLEALFFSAQQKAHALSGDLDRLEYLTQYFCDHADELLYERKGGTE